MTLDVSVIEQCGVVAVLRRVPASQVLPVVEAVVSGGIQSIEITMDNTHALSTIQRLRSKFDADALVGAGTIRTLTQLDDAAQAGAQFLVSPHLDLRLVERAHDHGLLFIPGILSPTELALALDAGLNLVKLFPARSVGPAHIKDLHGPFPSARIMPTGGVDVDNAIEFISAGAVAVGLGSSLVPSHDLDNELYDDIRRRAETVITAVAAAKVSGHR